MNAHTNTTALGKSASLMDAAKVRSDLDGALTLLSEVHHLTELLWLAAGSIEQDNQSAILVGVSTIQGRITAVRELVEQSWKAILLHGSNGAVNAPAEGAE